MRKFYAFYLFILCACMIITNAHAQTFVAPFGSLPDPNIVYHNGWYYYSGTNGSGIYMKKAQTLEGLKHTTLTRVFAPSTGGAPCCDFWAPEMFRINNKWYIYYTAKYTGEGQRTYVIENTSDDPMSGTWTHKGKIYDTQNDLWAIDGTILETNGQMYFIWSGVAKASDGDKPQRLYIARMTNPWTLQPGRVLLASPSLYNWEKDGGVNEGPAIIQNNGKIFLTYSANGCWTENYLIGTLYMNEGGNPLNAALWTKYDKPIFTKYPDRDVYGPGHHSFFKSPDGKETWFTYHATPDAGGACDMGRTTRAQKVNWDANGFPSLGIPDPTGAWLTAPAGEVAIPAGSVLPNGIYKIKPTSSTNKVLDVSGCSPMRGTNVAQWQDNGLTCQQWHIIATPDGYYSINAVKGGLALDVENCATTNSANVRMWTPSGGDCQKWILEPVSAGVYRIKSKKSGKVLDIQFGGDNNGANLQIYDYLGNAQQHFKLELLENYGLATWESHNLAGHFIRHQNGRARVDKNISPEKDGQWRMVPGLAGKGVSFQSVNYPNSYLRAVSGSEVWSRTNDGSVLFQEEATFYVRQGLADAAKVSFESYKYAGSYIRHKNYLLFTEKVTTATGYSDATFNKSMVNKAPVVSLTAPTAGTAFTAPASVTISANASDADGPIAKVEFYNGTTLLNTDASAPYSYNWPNVAAGTYSITAKAYDNVGTVTTSQAVSITVKNPNVAPTVSLTAPTAGTSFVAPATVNIAATAADSDGSIAKVEFYNGTTLLNSDATAPYSYSWTGVAVGTYSITARAYDNLGLTTNSAAVSITVKANVAPTVSLTAPATGTSFVAPATVNIAATAADQDGSIAKVEFYNGTTLLNSDATAPYSYSWTGVAAGSYSITARAYDNLGLTTNSAAVSITVNPAQTGTENCAKIAPWKTTAIYVNEDFVTHNNIKYKAKWWTRNENPASNSGQSDVWLKIGECLSGTAPAAVGVSVEPQNEITQDINSPLNISVKGLTSGNISEVSYILYEGTNRVHITTQTSPEFNTTWTAPQIGQYKLQIVAKDQNGMLVYSDATDINITRTTGIDDQTITVLSLYPNPTPGIVNLNGDVNGATLFDLSGKVLEELNITASKQIDLTGYASGTYLLKLQLESGSHFFKIIKE